MEHFCEEVGTAEQGLCAFLGHAGNKRKWLSQMKVSRTRVRSSLGEHRGKRRESQSVSMHPVSKGGGSLGVGQLGCGSACSVQWM